MNKLEIKIKDASSSLFEAAAYTEEYNKHLAQIKWSLVSAKKHIDEAIKIVDDEGPQRP